ncbi:g1431 [Coccomyxa elongata]
MVHTISILSLLVVSFVSFLSVEARFAPVILVPGLAGSVLEARLNRTEAPAWYCSKTSKTWRLLWLSLQEAALPVCLLDELAVFYNATTGRYSNQTGVEIRPMDWGGLGGVESLDPSLPQITPVYKSLTEGLKKAGYAERVDLFGAPYDFRLAADGLEQVGFFQNLTNLVEHAVVSNEGQAATIVAHSLGCLVSLSFLTGKSQEWLDKHVSSLVAISAPWGGSVTALKGSISGDNFDISIIPHDLLRPVQSTAPSGPWLFPSPKHWGDSVLVQTGKHNYTAKDALQLLKDLNLTQQAAVYPRVHNLTYPLPKVNFKVHCMYGTGRDTDEGYVYDVDAFNASAPSAPSKVMKGDGDGTVNTRSLEACKELGDKATLKFFGNASHTGILADKRLLKEVAIIATGSRKSGPWVDINTLLQQA